MSATTSPTRVNRVPESPALAEGLVAITSPILGVFYAQPQPGADPFVTVGSEVQEDTTVALLEVMKTFNAVPAGVRGTIVEICATNAQMVEFGQPLFRVRPPGAEG
jgi:acetyl-CoA carboxylase biotin carboxyl carrier protein